MPSTESITAFGLLDPVIAAIFALIVVAVVFGVIARHNSKDAAAVPTLAVAIVRLTAVADKQGDNMQQVAQQLNTLATATTETTKLLAVLTSEVNAVPGRVATAMTTQNGDMKETLTTIVTDMSVLKTGVGNLDTRLDAMNAELKKALELLRQLADATPPPTVDAAKVETVAPEKVAATL